MISHPGRSVSAGFIVSDCASVQRGALVLMNIAHWCLQLSDEAMVQVCVRHTVRYFHPIQHGN